MRGDDRRMGGIIGIKIGRMWEIWENSVFFGVFRFPRCDIGW